MIVTRERGDVDGLMAEDVVILANEFGVIYTIIFAELAGMMSPLTDESH